MKVLVCGDRNWTDRKRVFVVLSHVYAGWLATKEEGETFTIIEGQCRGADKIGGEWAEMMKKRGVIHDPVPAQWDRYGRGAGPKRNQEMLDRNPDLVVAFHDAITESRGTKDMVGRAEKAGVKTWLIHHDGAMI